MFEKKLKSTLHFKKLARWHVVLEWKYNVKLTLQTWGQISRKVFVHLIWKQFFILIEMIFFQVSSAQTFNHIVAYQIQSEYEF